jgi:hypothetical protein
MIYYSCKSEAARALLQMLDELFGETENAEPFLRATGT